MVDLGLLLWVLAVTVNYPPEATEDRLDGVLTAVGAATSAWIGWHRTGACRELERDAVSP